MINLLFLAFYINQISAPNVISICIVLIGFSLTMALMWLYSNKNLRFLIQIIRKYKNPPDDEMSQIINSELKNLTNGLRFIACVFFGIFGVPWIVLMFSNIFPDEMSISVGILITLMASGFSIMMISLTSEGETYSDTLLESKMLYNKENKNYKKLTSIAGKLANRYILKLEIEKAIECWKHAKEGYIQLHRKDIVVYENILIAASYFEMKKKDVALEFLNEARNVALEIGDLNSISEIEDLELKNK